MQLTISYNIYNTCQFFYFLLDACNAMPHWWGTIIFKFACWWVGNCACALRQFVNALHFFWIGVSLPCFALRLGGEEVRLMVWDTAGQEEFDAITRAYYRGAQACVLAFSTTDRDSFEAVRSWKKKVCIKTILKKWIINLVLITFEFFKILSDLSFECNVCK